MYSKPAVRLILGFSTLLLLVNSCNRISRFEVVNPQFAGRQTCLECHEKEYNLWVGSDHDNAMDTAIAETVLGDFNNAEFTRDGFTSRFYTREGKYYVYTKGPGGIPGEFQIAYTFGVRPLQQYLVPFEGGRLQCLQIAWDTELKRWYHLHDYVYSGEDIDPDDWLYWTNNGQNWNTMCAECHSTNLKKNYSLQKKVYNTTWFEIDVSCEACHGPGSEHNRWANFNKDERPEAENYALVVPTSNISSQKLVEQCAYCHARRTSFEDFMYPRDQVFDIMSPQLPIEPYYYHDGQILEEDYVYGSFTQSKMHKKDVRCTFCHDAHSLKLKFDGNRLCYQCHIEEKYSNYNHHFHKLPGEDGKPLILDDGKKVVPVGEGSKCILCHMPGERFMGVDYRRDHSMRIPRPDLSDKLGTPNACTHCHTDRSNAWAAGYTHTWYGPPTRYHFGETMFKASKNDTSAVTDLLHLIDDDNTGGIVRAAGVYYLGMFTGNNDKIREKLTDKDPLVRREAVRGFTPIDVDDLVKSVSPLLNDSTRMIRMEAAFKLSILPVENFDTSYQELLNSGINEYIKAMEYSADFAASRHNLGNIYSNIGQIEKAIENYKEAIRIDSLFYPAQINLSMLYNKSGNNVKALELLEYVVKRNPELGDAWYSLGLLQSEMGDYIGSTETLKKAGRLMPERARIWFNLYRLQEFNKDIGGAENSINLCLELEPRNLEFLSAKIEFLVKQSREREAVEVAEKILEYYPDISDRAVIEDFISRNR